MESLRRKLLHASVKLKPRLCWRLQDVRDPETMGCLSGRTAYRMWNKPKRKKYIVVNKAGRNGRCEESSKPFEIINGVAKLGAFPAGFQG